MISLRPILKVRNRIREKGKSKNNLENEENTPNKEEENNEDESFLEELRKQGQFLE